MALVERSENDNKAIELPSVLAKLYDATNLVVHPMQDKLQPAPTHAKASSVP